MTMAMIKVKKKKEKKRKWGTKLVTVLRVNASYMQNNFFFLYVFSAIEISPDKKNYCQFIIIMEKKHFLSEDLPVFNKNFSVSSFSS